MEKVYRQPIVVRKWSVTTPSKVAIILHRVTFGLFGERPTVQLEEYDAYRYFTGYTNYHRGPVWDTVHRGVYGDGVFHINCRCSTHNTRR